MISISIRVKATARAKDSSMVAMVPEAISTVRNQAQRQLVGNTNHSRQLPKGDSMRQRCTTSPALMYQTDKRLNSLDM